MRTSNSKLRQLGLTNGIVDGLDSDDNKLGSRYQSNLESDDQIRFQLKFELD